MASIVEIWKRFIFISLVTFITSTNAQIAPQSSICTFVLMFIVLQSDAVMFEEDWIVGNTLLPRDFHAAAVAFWNNSIFILGGYGANIEAQFPFVEYNIWKDIIIDHGVNYFNKPIYGYGQFYCQQRNELHLISANGESLLVFDLVTTTTQSLSTTIPHNVGYSGCLVANDDYVFIIGGHNSNSVLDQLQILTVSSLEWLSNPPSLNNARRGAACVIHETSGFLYVAGGYPLDKGIVIEKIRSANILSNSWQITSELVHSADAARAVLYDSDYILIIGGWNAYNPHVANQYIQIIDTETDTVSLSSSTLNFPAAAAGVIMIENTIYKFGGEIDSWISTNKWESYDITTYSPSQPPSRSPVEATTNLASLSPIDATTLYPSISPTLTPTKSTFVVSFSTLQPSQSPSKFPFFSQSSSITVSEERNTNKTTPIMNEDESTSRMLLMIYIEICVVVGLIIIIIIVSSIAYKYFEYNTNAKQDENQIDANLEPTARNSVHLQKANSMSALNADESLQKQHQECKRDDGEEEEIECYHDSMHDNVETKTGDTNMQNMINANAVIKGSILMTVERKGENMVNININNDDDEEASEDSDDLWKDTNHKTSNDMTKNDGEHATN